MNQSRFQALNLTAPADATEYALRAKARRVVQDINGRLRLVKAEATGIVTKIQDLQQGQGAAANQPLIRITRCG